MGRISGKDKWETKTLSEIATDIYIGSEVTKDQLGTGTYPAIKCGDVNSGLPLHFTECISFVDESLIKNKKYFSKGDLLIGALAHKIEVLGKAAVYFGDQKCIAGAHVIVVNHNQNPKFLSYACSSKECRSQIKKYGTGVAVCEMRLSAIKQLQIPLPPLEEQERIVSLLDSLNENITNLRIQKESLTKNRKRQFNFLAKKLLSGFGPTKTI